MRKIPEKKPPYSRSAPAPPGKGQDRGASLGATHAGSIVVPSSPGPSIQWAGPCGSWVWLVCVTTWRPRGTRLSSSTVPSSLRGTAQLPGVGGLRDSDLRKAARPWGGSQIQGAAGCSVAPSPGFHSVGHGRCHQVLGSGRPGFELRLCDGFLSELPVLSKVGTASWESAWQKRWHKGGCQGCL